MVLSTLNRCALRSSVDMSFSCSGMSRTMHCQGQKSSQVLPTLPNWLVTFFGLV